MPTNCVFRVVKRFTSSLFCIIIHYVHLTFSERYPKLLRINVYKTLGHSSERSRIMCMLFCRRVMKQYFGKFSIISRPNYGLQS